MLKLSLALIVSVSAIALAGCSLIGANPKAPTKAEQLLFNTQTNYAQVTNVVPQVITTFQTNVVSVTNAATQAVTQTPQVVTTFVTNQVPQITVQTQYVETLKPQVAQGVQGIGTAVNSFFPGFGGLVSNGILILLGAWGYFRSNKTSRATTGALAQEIQTILNFVGQLPNGQQYVGTLTTFLQQHQQDEGIIEQVAAALANEVSNSDANAAANQVIATINALKSITTPVVPIATTL